MKVYYFFVLTIIALLFASSSCSIKGGAEKVPDPSYTTSQPPEVSEETQVTIDSTFAPPTLVSSDSTDTPTSTNTPVFTEFYTSTSDPYGRYVPHCAGGFIKNYFNGYYYFKVGKQVENEGYCVLSPIIIVAPQGIEQINIEVSYDSENSDDQTYVGFFYSCDTKKIGVWIDDYIVYYQNDLEELDAEKMKIIGEIPEPRNGHHIISVLWSDQIQVFVDNVKMSGNEAALQSCPTLPKDFFYGIKAEAGKRVYANVYNFEIFGKAP